MNNFDTLELQFQSPNELDFLEPINDFYRKINEIVLNQLWTYTVYLLWIV
jgi:hypothetical protein